VAISSATRRVLPMPASPLIRATDGPVLVSAASSRRRANSSARPTMTGLSPVRAASMLARLPAKNVASERPGAGLLRQPGRPWRPRPIRPGSGRRPAR
jgi:hypothetical protein